MSFMNVIIQFFLPQNRLIFKFSNLSVLHDWLFRLGLLLRIMLNKRAILLTNIDLSLYQKVCLLCFYHDTLLSLCKAIHYTNYFCVFSSGKKNCLKIINAMFCCGQLNLGQISCQLDHPHTCALLKNGLKTQKIHFLPVLELMLDSLTTIQVEPDQCPSHQSILLTQEPIQEIFMKKY